MTELEERLRTAFRTRADEIPDAAPPLDLPAGGTESAARRGAEKLRSLGRGRWLAPVAAAAAVVAVVAGVLAASSAARPRPAPAAAPIQMSVPPYYVALDSNRPPSNYPEPVAFATVRATATGAELARISPPSPYNSFVAVTGATDDRTFVLLATGPTDPFTQVMPERFFLLHIDPTAASAAQRAQLTALPASDIPGGNTARSLPFGGQVQTIALSPNGASLAAVLITATGPQGAIFDYYLYDYNLLTGAKRIWVRKLCGTCQSAELGNASGSPDLAGLSWAANGKSLAFVVGSATSASLRLLNLSGAGDNVQPDSTMFDIHTARRAWLQAVMTPDGKTVFVSYNVTHGFAFSQVLQRFSAVSGQLTTINTLPLIVNKAGQAGGYSNSGPLIADTILWTNYDGSKVIIADAARGHTAGVYSGGTYTPLPWPANAIGAAW
jgi:hypothetical protein